MNKVDIVVSHRGQVHRQPRERDDGDNAGSTTPSGAPAPAAAPLGHRRGLVLGKRIIWRRCHLLFVTFSHPRLGRCTSCGTQNSSGHRSRPPPPPPPLPPPPPPSLRLQRRCATTTARTWPGGRRSASRPRQDTPAAGVAFSREELPQEGDLLFDLPDVMPLLVQFQARQGRGHLALQGSASFISTTVRGYLSMAGAIILGSSAVDLPGRGGECRLALTKSFCFFFLDECLLLFFF